MVTGPSQCVQEVEPGSPRTLFTEHHGGGVLIRSALIIWFHTCSLGRVQHMNIQSGIANLSYAITDNL